MRKIPRQLRKDVMWSDTGHLFHVWWKGRQGQKINHFFFSWLDKDKNLAVIKTTNVKVSSVHPDN